MKCPYCNQEIEDGSAVCPICEKELIQQSPPSDSAESAPVEETADPVTEAEKASEGETAEESTGTSAVTEQNPEEDSAGAASETEQTPEEDTAPQPIQSETAGSGSGEGEVRKTGKKKAGIIAGIIIVVAALVGISAFAMSSAKKDPKEAVFSAFKSITEPAKTNPFEELTGWGEIAKKRNSSSTTAQLQLKFEGSSDPDLSVLKSGEVTLNASSDLENKKSAAKLGLGYGGMDIANLDFYMDDKTVAVAIPELSSKAFTLNYADDLEGQIARSPYFGQLLSDSGVDLKSLEDYFKKSEDLADAQNQLFDVKALWDRYKEGSKAIEDFKTAMTVTEADTKEFTIDGKKQNCQGYSVVIKKEDAVKFLRDTKDFFIKDASLKKDFVSYMTIMKEMQTNLGNYMYSTLDPERFQVQLWGLMDHSSDQFFDLLESSMDDLNLTVYTRKDGKMASFDYNTNLDVAGETIKVYGTVTFGGGYSMLANVNASMTLKDSTGETIEVKLDKTGEYEAKKSLKSGLDFVMSSGDESYSMNLSGSYLADGGAFTLNANFGANGDDALRLSARGSIENVKKGESADVIFDSIKGEIPDYWEMNPGDEWNKTNTQYMELSGSYKLGPLAGPVEVPQGTAFDMLAASEDDWDAAAMEIYGNAIGLAMKFYK